jgi:uncharacterized membrane protein
MVFGIFAGTFTYALVVLGGVRTNNVPGDCVYFAIALVLLCVGSFFRLLATLRTRLTSGGLVRTIGNELRAAFEELYPAVGEEAVEPASLGDSHHVVALHHLDRPGVFQSFDEEELVQLASSLDAVVDIEVVVGDFVPSGSRLATVSAASGPPDTETFCRLVHIGAVRTLNQDPAYGFRLLADVGVRALSPAVNDPTTAVQTLDQLDDLLHRLASRPLGNGEIVDESGVARVRYRAPNWEVFVSLALDEIRIAGASSLQVVRRLRALLGDLSADVPAPRQAVVIERLQALDENVSRFETPFDRRQAAMPDRQGIGQPSRASAVPGDDSS